MYKRCYDQYVEAGRDLPLRIKNIWLIRALFDVIRNSDRPVYITKVSAHTKGWLNISVRKLKKCINKNRLYVRQILKILYERQILHRYQFSSFNSMEQRGARLREEYFQTVRQQLLISYAIPKKQSAHQKHRKALLWQSGVKWLYPSKLIRTSVLTLRRSWTTIVC